MNNLSNADFNLNVESVTKDANCNLRGTGYGSHYGSDGMEYEWGDCEHYAKDFIILENGRKNNF